MEPKVCWIVFGLCVLGHLISASPIQFNSCIAKLEYLCLRNLVNLADQYEKNSAIVIDDLEQRISDRVALYNATRGTTVINARAAVTSAVTVLIDRVMARIPEDPYIDFQNCLKATLPLITNYQNTKMTAIGTCSSNSIVNISSELTALTNLNATSTDSVNRLCDCVLNITPCSKSKEKAVAKGCAQSNGNSLNSTIIQQQANAIYSSVETKILSAESALEQCISAINISSDRDSILTQINTCLAEESPF